MFFTESPMITISFFNEVDGDGLAAGWCGGSTDLFHSGAYYVN